MVVHKLAAQSKQSVRLKWAAKQEYKESINFVLVTPQHNILWAILLDKDSMSQKGHTQTGTVLHREIITLWEAFMQNRGDTSCSTHMIGTASSLSTLTGITKIWHDQWSTSKSLPPQNLSMLWSIFMDHKYQQIMIQNRCVKNHKRC